LCSRREAPGVAGTVAKALVLVLAIWGSVELHDTSWAEGKWYPVVLVISGLMLVCLLSPLHKFVDEHFLELAGVGAGLWMLTVLVSPELARKWWTSTFERQDFALVPLSEMKVGDYFLAVLGAAAYVGAYVVAQQWRTNGKWLDELRRRMRGEA